MRDILTQYLLVALFSLLSFMSVFYFYKERKYQLPIMAYMGVYFFSSFIGNILLLFFGSDIFFYPETIATVSFGFLFLLYAPFFIPIWVIFLIRLMKKIIKFRVSFFSYKKIDRIEKPIFSLWFFCFALMVIYIYSNTANALFNIGSIDYIASIAQRYEVFASLGIIGTGLTYTTLPLVAYISLYQMMMLERQSQKSLWFFLFIVSSMFIFYFVIGVMQQKSVFAVYMLLIAWGWSLLTHKKIKYLLLVGVGIYALVFWYQSRTHLDWDSWDTLGLLFFRMALGLQYGYYLYSQVLPHPGFKSLQGVTPIDNEPISRVIFSKMHPHALLDGDIPVPAHFDAYAQVGWLFVVFILICIGIIIEYVASIKIDSAFKFAWYLAMLSVLYYLTQISFVLSILGSYGVVFSIVPLGVIFFLHYFFRFLQQKL